MPRPSDQERSNKSDRTASVSDASEEWRERRQRGGRAGNMFFTLLARSGRFGLFFVPFFLFWVALYFVLAAPTARRASFDLARRLGRRSLLARLAFAFRHFYGFGRSLIDRIAILSGKDDLYTFTSHGHEHIDRALEQGNGVVLLTAHLGNWEVMAQVLSGMEANVTLVMYDGVQPDLRRTIEDMAQGRAFRVLFTDGSPSSAAAILSALADGDVVGLMGDRVLAGRSALVPFLGGRARFPVGSYAVAAAAKAPLMHVFAVREGSRRYAFHGFPADLLEFGDRRNKQPDLDRWAAAFAARVEEFVRRYPEQWGNLFSVWEA